MIGFLFIIPIIFLNHSSYHFYHFFIIILLIIPIIIIISSGIIMYPKRHKILQNHKHFPTPTSPPKLHQPRRFALLCGRPPFETATLRETYLRITMRKYSTPPHVTISAKNLIRSLLSLDPHHRPPLAKILKHNFFYDGFFPQELSPSTCEIQPKFPLVAIEKSNFSNFNNLHSDTSALAQSKNSRKSASQVVLWWWCCCLELWLCCCSGVM